MNNIQISTWYIVSGQKLSMTRFSFSHIALDGSPLLALVGLMSDRMGLVVASRGHLEVRVRTARGYQAAHLLIVGPASPCLAHRRRGAW